MFYIYLGYALHDALVPFGLTSDETKRSKVIAFIRDGCSTNTAALRILRPLFFKTCDIKCISHAANNVGSVLYDSCKISVKFINLFNNMLNTSTMARLKFKALIHTGIKRFSGDIRWYYLQDSASQIYKFWPQVLLLIADEDDFTPSIRTKLTSLLEEDLNTIRLELSLLEDVAIPLAKLCYKQEGDGFLIPSTYDHWYNILSLLNDLFEGRIELENVSNTASLIFPGDVLNKTEAIANTRVKMFECVQKMTDTSTSHDKLYFTLNIFRACRLLNFKFIAQTPMQSLLQLPTLPGDIIRGEIIQLYNLPFIARGRNDIYLKPFIEELPKYRNICLDYVNDHGFEDLAVIDEEEPADKMDMSDAYLDFWKRNVLELPTFSNLARKMLSCSPSSATVERLFSLLSCFDDNSSSSLADMAKARTIIRYNHNFRSRKDNYM
jgi:hypothetical protein